DSMLAVGSEGVLPSLASSALTIARMPSSSRRTSGSGREGRSFKAGSARAGIISRLRGEIVALPPGGLRHDGAMLWEPEAKRGRRAQPNRLGKFQGSRSGADNEVVTNS